MLGKVAQKLVQERCRVALCTPEWDAEPWWQLLETVPHQRVRFPLRYKLFFGGYRKDALPQVKSWRTVVWLLDNRASKILGGNGGKGIAELKEALAKVERVDWSHGR